MNEAAKKLPTRTGLTLAEFVGEWRREVAVNLKVSTESHLSSLLADGATPAIVQRQLRHFDARITLEVYGHVIGDEQRSVVQNRSARLVN